MATNGHTSRIASADDILPVQFHTGPAITPEHRLMAAVLEDALHVALKPTLGDRRSLRAQTDEWLFSDDASWPFAFVNVCDALGLDPVWLRNRVLAERSATRARRAA